MIKNLYFQYRNKSFLGMRILVIGIGVLILFCVIIFFPHFFRNTYIVTVVNKHEFKENNVDKYIIYTEKENGSIMVFQNYNSLLEFKIDSQDVYMEMAVNKKYEVSAYGINMPVISSYQNIISIKGVPTKVK